MTKAVTIWMPTKNSEAHLQETLDSIYAQSFKDWRLIISDDRSTDSTPAILFKQSDVRVTCIETPEVMKGIDHMQWLWGQLDNMASDREYTIHIGAHDNWSPNFLEVLVSRMQLHEQHGVETSIIYPDTYMITETGEVCGQYKDIMNYGQLPAMLIPQQVIGIVSSPQLFGLWNETVRRACSFRYPCSGWDHLIIMDAVRHAGIYFESNVKLFMRAPIEGNATLAKYGERHLSNSVRASGDLDFIRQLDWCLAMVDHSMSDVPEPARPLYERLLTASMLGTYIALRGVNLETVPGAAKTFNMRPEVQQIFAALDFVFDQSKKLRATLFEAPRIELA